MALPKSCDYLIVGGGATGMAFADSLLHGPNNDKISVVVLDKHDAPGGQWNDSYAFVQLHQPSAGYGVETVPMEPNGDKQYRSMRIDVLDYYNGVKQQLAKEFDFHFVGGATLDLNAPPTDSNSYKYVLSDGTEQTIKVKRRLVDARYLEPDLPITVAPKFEFDADKIQCLPLNSLVSEETANSEYYVVIGAGKTGMDGVYHLLTNLKVDPANIVWVMPHDPWITARENIGNCMEFLRTATTLNLSLKSAFRQWEKEGRVYRLGEEEPTKFKDATLSKEELAILRQIPTPNVIRGKGRVARIQDDGKLVMENEEVLELPFPSTNHSKVTYLHCSAGAFNYTKQIGAESLPVFRSDRITIQDVYGTPGFCFVGSILGRLESINHLTDEQRNEMSLAPGPSQEPTSKLGFTTGDVGVLTGDHGFVQRLKNLRAWLAVEEVRNWLVGHRLFNLGHYKSADDMDQLVEETWSVLKEHGMVED